MSKYNSFFQLYSAAREELFNVADGAYDARRLLLTTFDVSVNELLLHFMDPFTDEQQEKADRYWELLQLRKTHIPLQYITGEQSFYGMELKVNEDVLIPRQDTEILVEKILNDTASNGADAAQLNMKEWIEQVGRLRVLDMCTGSGCIAIALKKLGGFGHVFASDISRKALELADENARANGVDILFYESDMFSELGSLKDLDMIICNPPYIRSDVIDTLQPEVKDHEPRLALDGGADGLDFYRIIAAEAPQHLRKGGKLYLEIGYDQADDVTKLLTDAGFKNITVEKDLAELDRVISAVWE